MLTVARSVVEKLFKKLSVFAVCQRSRETDKKFNSAMTDSIERLYLLKRYKSIQLLGWVDW